MPGVKISQVVITQRKLNQNRKYFILWRKGLARGLKKQRWKILCTVSVRDIIKLSQRHLVDCLQALLIWPFIPNLTEIFDRSVLKLTYPLKVKFWPARALSRTAKFSPLLIHFKRESHMILTPFSMSQNHLVLWFILYLHNFNLSKIFRGYVMTAGCLSVKLRTLLYADLQKTSLKKLSIVQI